MNISFLANSIDDTATKSFGAGTMSSSWTVHRREVSFGFGSTMTTILFPAVVATLQGGVFEGAEGTSIFSTVKAGVTGGTGLFGIAGSFLQLISSRQLNFSLSGGFSISFSAADD